MLDRTQIAAALFQDGGGMQIRLYYQDGANHIRESAFDGARGWLPPAQANGDIVAVNAKRFTPLTVLSSPDGSAIWLFYLNAGNNLVERKYRRSVGRWEDGQQIATQSLASDTTKLASAGSTDHARVFYQATDNTVRQTSCTLGGQVWVDAATDSQTQSAARGTSLGAVTNPNDAGDITLFYQGGGGEVESLHLEQNNWRYERFAPALAATPTPLAATSLFYTSQSKTYTYEFSLPNASNRIDMVARVRGNSNNPSTTAGSETMSTSTATPVQSGSAITVGRDPAGDKVHVFYQLDDKSIGHRILDRYGASSNVAAVKVPTATATTGGGTTTNTNPTPTPAPSNVTQPTVPDWATFTQGGCFPPAPPPWPSSAPFSSGPPMPPMPPMPPAQFMDFGTDFGSWDMAGPSGPPPPPPPPGPGGPWPGFGSDSSFFTGSGGNGNSSFYWSRRSGQS